MLLLGTLWGLWTWLCSLRGGSTPVLRVSLGTGCAHQLPVVFSSAGLGPLCSPDKEVADDVWGWSLIRVSQEQGRSWQELGIPRE